MKKAAEEKSPGTLSRWFVNCAGGCSVVRKPSMSRRTPQFCSIRSLWSRLTAGAMTVVAASAYSAANRIADFTCALATGIRYSMPCRRRPPPMSTGGVPLCVRTSAPIERSGAATRSIGRFMSEASPIN